MTVFKNYFKILSKNKGIIIMYTCILLVFTLFSTSSNNTQNFTATKPNIAVINNDCNSKVVNNLEKYIKKNANIVNIKKTEQSLSDALFYRDVDSILYIYDGYTFDYLKNQEKTLDIKYTNNQNSAYMKMLLERYFKISDVVNNNINNEDKIISTINNFLKKESTIKIKSTINTDSLSKASYYFNFANYSILAVSIYIIAVVMSTFNKPKIKRRNYISSKKISELTKELYLGNLVFTLIVWLFVILISLFVVGKTMFTINGLLFIINSFIFMTSALGIGFLTGSIMSSKDAINGIVNVFSLGSSFLCGCFIPSEYLPQYVIKIAHIFPSYWYIKNNDLIKSIEVFDFKTNIEVIFNMLVVIIFAAIFLMLTILYNKKHAEN